MPLDDLHTHLADTVTELNTLIEDIVRRLDEQQHPQRIINAIRREQSYIATRLANYEESQ